MSLLSDIKTDQRPAADDNEAQVRSRARRRLIGAGVLLAVGVIGFPLLFETKPRPVAADVPAVTSRDSSAAASAPTKVIDRATAAAAAASSVVATAQVKPAASPPPMITERAQDAGREIPIPPPAADAARVAREKAERERVAKELADKDKTDKDKAEKERVAKAKAERDRVAREQQAQQQAKVDDARRVKAEDERRARALLESRKPIVAADSDAGRFAVQVGAFASDNGVRDVRNKLERVGLKSYTQVVASGTRVRTGPYASRREAEQAAEKARSIGFQPSIVPLPGVAGSTGSSGR